jgi:hypothetical protein
MADTALGAPGRTEEALITKAERLLPQWSAFSDPFMGTAVAPGVTAFSWFAAAFEIAAGLAFGVAGLQLMKEK